MATDDAYLRACRALNWRTAQLRAHGIEPLKLNDSHGHEPPLCFDFGVPEGPKVGDGTGDAAIAIGEHAFRAGFAKGHQFGLGTDLPCNEHSSGADRAWNDYDPPEYIKDLS